MKGVEGEARMLKIGTVLHVSDNYEVTAETRKRLAITP